MKKKGQSIFVILLATFMGGLLGCQASWPRSVPHQTILTHETTIPLDLSSFVPIVQVSINGSPPMRFMLDTGSATVVVRPEIADALNLPQGAIHGSQFIRSAHGIDAVRFCSIERLTLGDATFLQLDTKVIDLPKDMLGNDRPIDGILGLRAFYHILLTLDYPAKQLRLTPNKSLDINDREVLPVQLQFGQHLVIKMVIGEKIFPAIVDTGTSMGLYLLEEDHKEIYYANGPIPIGKTTTPTGGVQTMVGRLGNELVIGPHRLKNVLAYHRTFSGTTLISPKGSEAYFGAERSLIGGQVLRHFVITIDQQHNLIRFHRDQRGVVDSRYRNYR